MKWYEEFIYEGVYDMLHEVQDRQDIFVYLILLPIALPLVAACSIGVGLYGLMVLTLNPKTYESLSDRIFALVLFCYYCVGVVVITGTYIAVVTLFERFVE